MQTRKLAFIAFFVLIGISASVQAQDLIVTKEGDSLNCKITKVETDYIYFGINKDGGVLNTLLPMSQITYYKYQLMETIASSLSDKKLTAIAEEYGDRLYEADDTVIEDEGSEEGNTAVEEPATEDPANGDTVEGPDTDNDTAVENSDAKPQTFGERRAALVTKFINAADQRIATGA